MRKDQFLLLIAFLLLGGCKNETHSPQEMAGPPPPVTTFTRDLSWGDVSLHIEAISSKQGMSLNDISITGQVGDAKLQPVMIADADPLKEAAVADLDGDGRPELYSFTQGAGSGSYGTVIAYAIFPDGSVTQINLQPMNESMQEGYMGHDAFAVEGGRLVRSFPVYREGDTNDRPTGGSRKVVYTLEAGEAAPQLVPVGE